MLTSMPESGTKVPFSVLFTPKKGQLSSTAIFNVLPLRFIAFSNGCCTSRLFKSSSGQPDGLSFHLPIFSNLYF